METEQEKVINAYMEAAEKGDASAQYKVGMSYAITMHDSSSENWIKNGEYAEMWLRKSAEQKYPQAMGMLGVMYLIGEDIAPDVEKGAQLVIEAAKLGDSSAKKAILNNLGVITQETEGKKHA